MPGGYTSKKRVYDRYRIIGFISSGTYGRVYKAVGKNGQLGEFAIKKYGVSLRRSNKMN
jgi:cyclin-dependent kinase 8/11